MFFILTPDSCSLPLTPDFCLSNPKRGRPDMKGDDTPHCTCTSRRVSEKRELALPATHIISYACCFRTVDKQLGVFREYRVLASPSVITCANCVRPAPILSRV
jgi:hypothetical protein